MARKRIIRFFSVFFMRRIGCARVAERRKRGSADSVDLVLRRYEL